VASGTLGTLVSPSEPNNWLDEDDANQSRWYSDTTITQGKKYYYTLKLKSVSGGYSTDTTQYSITCGLVSATCTDSDGGLNYEEKGKVVSKQGAITNQIEDLCKVNGLDLDEFYCDSNNLIQESVYRCPLGCSDGACKTELSKPDLRITGVSFLGEHTVGDKFVEGLVTIKNEGVGDAVFQAPAGYPAYYSLPVLKVYLGTYLGTIGGEEGKEIALSGPAAATNGVTIPPGETRTYSFATYQQDDVYGRSDFLGSVGTKYMYFKIDPDNVVDELNENNNTQTDSIYVESTSGTGVVCTDSDGGVNEEEKGTTHGYDTVSKTYKTFYDKCDGTGRVIDYRCNTYNDPTGGNGYVSGGNVPCPAGTSCSDGACTRSTIDINPINVTLGCDADQKSVTIWWKNPDTIGLEQYFVYRSNTLGELGMRVSPNQPHNWLGQDDANKRMFFTDKTINQGKRHYYTIKLRDINGNYSTYTNQHSVLCGTSATKPDLRFREYFKTYVRNGIPLAYIEVEDLNRNNTNKMTWILTASDRYGVEETYAGTGVGTYINGYTMNLSAIGVKLDGVERSISFRIDPDNLIDEFDEGNNIVIKKVKFESFTDEECKDDKVDLVCGKDGFTYNNECYLKESGQALDYYGPCRTHCREIKTTNRKATFDDYWKFMGTDANKVPDILKYRLKWFTGSWSPWYYPGHDDMDWKTNLNGTKRLVWAYFYDHEHEFVKCERSGNKQPDLVIKGIKIDYDASQKKLLINATVKNVGEADAYSPYNMVGMWVDINDKEYGWNRLPVSDTSNNLFLKAGVSRTFTFSVGPSFLKDTNNVLTFYIDRSYDRDHIYLMPNGYIKESNENNNKFIASIFLSNHGTVTIDDKEVYETDITGEDGDIPGSEIRRLKQQIKELRNDIRELREEFIMREKQMIKKIDKVLTARLKGKILLQVEEKGEAWYISPVNEKKYFLGYPEDAFGIMRDLGLGITNADLEKIDVGLAEYEEQGDADGDGLPDGMEEGLGTDKNKADTDGDGFNDYDEVKDSFNPLGAGKRVLNSGLVDRLQGRILLQVEKKGEAWYINPDDNKRYYLGRPADAFGIMRGKGLGITNDDLRKIEIDEVD